MDRESRKLTHSKETVKGFKEGNPTSDDIKNGTFSLWYIPGKGLYMVANHNGELKYLKFSNNR